MTQNDDRDYYIDINGFISDNPRSFGFNGSGGSGGNGNISWGLNSNRRDHYESIFQKAVERSKFDVEGFKGKFIAYVTYNNPDIVKINGILFVRKCNAWKLIETEKFTQISSGSQGSYDSVKKFFTIHYYIVNNEKQALNTTIEQNRFADLDIINEDEI